MSKDGWKYRHCQHPASFFPRSERNRIERQERIEETDDGGQCVDRYHVEPDRGEVLVEPSEGEIGGEGDHRTEADDVSPKVVRIDAKCIPGQETNAKHGNECTQNLATGNPFLHDHISKERHDRGRQVYDEGRVCDVGESGSQCPRYKVDSQQDCCWQTAEKGLPAEPCSVLFPIDKEERREKDGREHEAVGGKQARL